MTALDKARHGYQELKIHDKVSNTI